MSLDNGYGVPRSFSDIFHRRPAFDPNAPREAQILQLNELIANVVTSRSQLFQQIFDPRRDIDDECGYPSTQTGFGVGSIDPDFYRALYEREALATKVVQVMPKEAWQKNPSVYEDEDPENATEFESDWDTLGQQLRGERSWYKDEEGSPVWEYLRRADILSGIGHFGVLLIGIDDGKNLDQPVDGVVSYDPPQTVKGSNTPTDKAPTSNTYHSGIMKVPVRNRSNSSVTHQAWPSTPTKEIDSRPVYTRDERGFPRLTGNQAFDPTKGDEPVGGWAVYNAVKQVMKPPPSNQPPSPSDGNNQDDQPTNRPTGQQGPNQQQQQGPVSGWGTPAGFPGTYQGPENYPSSFAGAQGTDAQYVGVQLSPPEFPSEDTPTEKRKLLFLRAFDESLVQIVQYEADLRNPRFGQPIMYRITLNDPREMHSGVGLPMATVRVHWSRVIHLADNLGSSEIFGVPRMRPVLNRLLDLRKLYGGSAEMYWRGAFPGLSIETIPQLGGDVDIDVSGVKDQLEQYMNGLQRYLTLMGLQAKTLAPQVVDPSPQINIQIEAICIQLDMPVRVFKGSERGELASSQDDAKWNDRIKSRNLMYTTPRIIVPLVDRFIAMGVLSEPKGTDSSNNAKDRIKKASTPPKQPTPPNGQGQGQPSTNPQGGDSGQGGPSQDAEQSGGKPDTSPNKVKPFGGPTSNQRRPYRERTISTNLRDLPPGDYNKVKVKWVWVRNAEGEEELKPKVSTSATVTKTPSGYCIEWPDLDSNTDKDKAGIAFQITQAISAYVAGQCESILPVAHFYTNVLGWDEEEVAEIMEGAKEQEENLTIPQMGEEGHPASPPPPPPPVIAGPGAKGMPKPGGSAGAGKPSSPPSAGTPKPAAPPQPKPAAGQTPEGGSK